LTGLLGNAVSVLPAVQLFYLPIICIRRFVDDYEAWYRFFSSTLQTKRDYWSSERRPTNSKRFRKPESYGPTRTLLDIGLPTLMMALLCLLISFSHSINHKNDDATLLNLAN